MALFKIILFDSPSKEKKDGTFPVTLKVTYKGKRKYFYLGFDAKPSQWNKTKFNSKYPNHNNCNETLNESLSNAEAVRKEMAIEGQEFTLSEFEKRFRASGDSTISSLFNLKIKDPVKPLAISTIGRYKTTLNMLIHYKGDVQINEVNENYIAGFIEWLKRDRVLKVKDRSGNFRNIVSHSCNPTTIYNYLKDLRSIYSYAIKAKLANQSNYPFQDVNIEKYKIETSKRAISKEKFDEIENLKIDSTYGKLAKDIILFTFSCRGINFADLIRLTSKNIIYQDDAYFIEYYRAKTNKRFSIKLRSNALEIIEKYTSDPFFEKRGYIFPILDQNVHTTEKKIFNRKKSMLKKINKALNEEIKPKIGLEGIDLTTYVARHSYANLLYKNNVPIGTISEFYKHSNEKTTKVYIRSILDHELDEIDEKIFGE